MFMLKVQTNVIGFVSKIINNGLVLFFLFASLVDYTFKYPHCLKKKIIIFFLTTEK